MIYALQPLMGGPVKIGTTEDLAARTAQLEAHYRQPESAEAKKGKPAGE